MKFQGEFDGSDKRKYPKKKQTRRSKSGDTLIDDAVTSFPTEEEMSLRIAEPSIEEATPNVVESSIEEVLPSAGETPVEVASQSVVENAESAEVPPDVQESAFHDIPREQLKGVLEVFKSKGGWQRTPPPIIEALKTSGFTVRITKRGTAEKRGDTLQLSRPNDTEVHIYSTDEAAELLRKIIGEQRIREKHRKREKKELSQASVVGEDAPLPVNEDSEEAVAANTLPVTLDGEVVQNQAPDTQDFVEGDSDIEDAVILSETPRSNIGKEQVQKPAALTAEILKDEKSEDDDVAHATDEMLRERASRIATVRAEILASEEGGEEETLELRAEISPALERPKKLNESVLSAFGVTDENWELIPGSGNISTDEIEEVLARTIREEGGPEHTETSPAPERPQMFDERLASEFGVTKEMWDRIPGSEKLSFAQQKLVFENLREFSERDKTPHLARIWEGIKEKLGSKKDVGPTLDALSRLVESAALYGPKVHEEDGELLIDFVGLDMPRENRKEWKQAFDSLNEAAHRLSKTPSAWQEDGIGTHSEKESKMMSFIKESFSPARKRFNEYKEIEETYVAAKKELSRVLEAAHIDPIIIAERFVSIDKNVYALQFQQTSPDAVEAVKNIPDASMWKMIGKSLCKPSNLGYMALGAVSRTALAGVMGVFAAPVTSAAIAGSRAWNRSAAEMRERDRAARMGTRDTSDEALNIVSAEMSIDIGGEKREVGATQKLQKLIDEYQILVQVEETQQETPEYKKKMSTLVDRIKVRASYVEDKQRLNRISFGNKEERAVQMAKLYETLALAQMVVADRHVPKMSVLEDRLGKILFQKENTLQNKRRARQVKDASWNALRAGGFAAAGGLLAREIQELGLEEKSANLGGAQGVKGITAHDGPLLTPDEAARASADSTTTAPGNAPLPMETAIPKVAEVPEVPKLESYTIRPGDTLTKIMKEQLSEIQELGAGKEQNTAIANILRELSPEELRSIGVRSENPNLIYADETINIEALHKIIESHQSVIDDAATRVEEAAKVVEETGRVTVKVPEDSIVFNPSSKDDYFPDPTNASEQLNLRTLIYKDATENTERWMKLYPRANAQDAVKAGIVEGHFKNLFGEKWATTGEVRVTDLLTRGPQFQNENPDRLMYELKKLVETVEKPPMNVAPMPAENMKEYLERASMAYAERGNEIPGNNLIRKIETYYQATKR